MEKTSVGGLDLQFCRRQLVEGFYSVVSMFYEEFGRRVGPTSYLVTFRVKKIEKIFTSFYFWGITCEASCTM